MAMLTEILIEDPRWQAAGIGPLAERAARMTLGHLGLDPAQWEISILACDDARIAVLNGDFRDRDLYVFCIDMEGVVLSQPIKPELVGKNMFNFNRYGDLLFQDMIAVANASGAGWVDYRWPYPGTDEIRPKTSYIATNDQGFFCGVGAYK